MELDLLNELTDALDIMEHQELMMMIKASQFPHMSKENADTLHKYVHKMAYPAAYEEARQARMEALKHNV